MTSTASSSLRKACRTCTKRKRKCVVELPKCQRCRLRNLECTYDLEPLVSNGGAVRRRSKTNTAIEASRRDKAPAHRFLQYISSLHMSDRIHACLVNRSLVHSLTAIPLTQDPEAVHYIIDEMLRIPAQVRGGKSTPFIHPRLEEPMLPRYLDAAIQETDVPGSRFLDVLNLNAEDMLLTELVSATQALILFLIKHAFSQGRVPYELIKFSFELLAKWRTKLWSTGFRGVSDDLTPWKSWILTESLRRTILMAFLVEGTYSAWTLGWCTHQLFVYALPFNTQGSLWLANSEAEWSAAGADTSTGNPSAAAARELTSLKELTLNFASKPFQPGADLFQKLLLISHHGKRPFESRLAQIGQDGAKPLMAMASFSV